MIYIFKFRSGKNLPKMSLYDQSEEFIENLLCALPYLWGAKEKYSMCEALGSIPSRRKKTKNHSINLALFLKVFLLQIET
jgi:hypothetical protein